MPKRIAINGFGRIGRAAYKILFDMEDVEVVAINDLTNARTLAYLLKYDTAYDIYEKEVYIEEDDKQFKGPEWSNQKDYYSLPNNSSTKLAVEAKNGKKLTSTMLSEPDASKLPWQDLQVDVVLECTGRFTKDGTVKVHVDAGAKAVVVSAPVKGEGGIQTFLRGVNDDQYLGQNVVSNASCTTNCISPVVDVVHRNFKILKSALTTVHAVTSTQQLVDGPPKGGFDMRRGRAAAFNMIPTTTGAAKATTEVIPDLKEKFDGIAIRVPVITGSISDITMLVEKKTTAEEINSAFIAASKDPKYAGVLAVTSEPVVSSDIIGNPYSSIVDLALTRVIDGDLVKVMAWYDNEWGYANRLVEMALVTIKG